MVEPLIVPRSDHSISRRDIDPDALKVLYRLKQYNYIAYLVGGSVRDLLLGRHPKDFDIGTSAHPYEVKRLFRNCWIIGRRFRLAHVRFPPNKIIEVATFRRKAEPLEAPPAEEARAPLPGEQPGVHRDNTFGTPEEDAFRRDFTVNALFYDIATFSIIDYVGGMEDLQLRMLRSIGDPDERFIEDPVRMLRAIVLSERLDLSIDAPILDAIAHHADEIVKASPARLIEEYYKILRSGASARIFRRLLDVGLLEHLSPELTRSSNALWQSLDELDEYRSRFTAVPDTLTNPILIGSLLVPLGMLDRRPNRRHGEPGEAQPQAERRHERRDAAGRPPRLALGLLPIARGDIEQLRHILTLQHRLVELPASPRAQRTLMHRQAYHDTMTWMDIHGRDSETVERWRALERGSESEGEGPRHDQPGRRRRRRRRRRRVRAA
jgi:poly(A) polymerase